MKKLLLVLLVLPHIIFAQDTLKSVPKEEIYDFVEFEPEFPGGPNAMHQWIVSQIEYPDSSRIKGEEGIVYIKFIVEKDGSIGEVKVARGVSPLLNAEAVRVISKMPKWTPGTQNGKAVRVNFTMPINFRLS